MTNFSFSRIAIFVAILWSFGISSVWADGLAGFRVNNSSFIFKAVNPFEISIMGKPIATKEQCVRYLLNQNPFPMITVTPEQLVGYYYEEAILEGIRPDVAFAQALHETGHFRYGGDVIPLQNNYCGLGTTGGGVKGAWFETAQIGVRAQVQHLMAYTTTRQPQLPVVDPRYELVTKSDNFGKSVNWTDLNGKWAVPGKTYGQMILSLHQRILDGH